MGDVKKDDERERNDDILDRKGKTVKCTEGGRATDRARTIAGNGGKGGSGECREPRMNWRKDRLGLEHEHVGKGRRRTQMMGSGSYRENAGEKWD